MSEYILRFFLGGITVTAFAVLGDVFRPKSFAGLFSAAPSIALSTLIITLSNQGSADAATEGRSMILGAIALWVYSLAACRLMKRYQVPALAASIAALLAWTFVAFGLKWIVLGAV